MNTTLVVFALGIVGWCFSINNVACDPKSPILRVVGLKPTPGLRLVSSVAGGVVTVARGSGPIQSAG